MQEGSGSDGGGGGGTYVNEQGCICPIPEEGPPPPVEKCECRLETCPNDPRFPNTNQTKRCYFSFIDYQRCVRLLGDYPGCTYFLRCYRALCPTSWTDKWYNQMEKGTFPRKIYPCKPIIYPPPFDPCQRLDQEDPPEEPPCP